MRVGVFSYDYLPSIGGLGVVLTNTVNKLREIYPENTYRVFSPSPDADDRVSAMAAWRWKKFGGCPFYSLILNTKMRKIIRKNKLDLVHVHAGSGGVFLLKKPACPLVVTAHHTYRQEADFVYSNPFRKAWKIFMSFLEKRTYSLADKIICVSRDTADILENKYGQNHGKIFVIENGLNETPENSSIRLDDTVLFIGRLEKRKGIWVLLRAFELARKNLPKIKLRIAGENLEGSSIFKFIKTKGLESCVSVMGYLEEPLMNRELNETSVIVIPSLVEGFGLVAAEAMQAGTCVVASDSPGLRRLIRDGETGLLFRAGDSEDCARCIEKVMTDKALRNRLALNAKAEAGQRFSLSERSRDVQRVYDS